LEHTRNINITIDEISRVLKTGGQVIITVPFCYNEHGTPDDFRRFTLQGAEQLLSRNFVIIELKKQGKFGSTVGTLMLNFINDSMNHNKFNRLLKGIIMPAWILFSGLVNIIAIMLNLLDKTDRYYGNVLIVARKC
jgi:SAM-dependent methyltransferase